MKNFYNFNVDNITGLSQEEKEFRNKELDLFDKNGFPNKREEAWKFTDLNTILSKNFTNITNDYISLRENACNNTNTLPITSRCLDSLIRLSQARAKLELRTIVTREDTLDIVKLV